MRAYKYYSEVSSVLIVKYLPLEKEIIFLSFFTTPGRQAQAQATPKILAGMKILTTALSGLLQVLVLIPIGFLICALRLTIDPQTVSMTTDIVTHRIGKPGVINMQSMPY